MLPHGAQPPPPSFHHEPVLVDEVLSFVPPGPGFLVDCTLGGGGHAEALLRAFPGARLFGCDRDADAVAASEARLVPFGERILLRRMPFSELGGHLMAESVDFMLADLGASSPQFDRGERGFSFSHDGPLDMRMDPLGEGPTAAVLVNTLSREALTGLLRRHGEERFARRIALAIEEARKDAPIERTGQLAALIAAAVPAGRGRRKHQRTLHPATRTFQALRIEVNGELDELSRLLDLTLDLLKPGGRLAVISFHSLEDRPVKSRFHSWESPCQCPPSMPYCICGKQAVGRRVTRKPVVPGEAESATNPRARSAKLRVFEKAAAEAAPPEAGSPKSPPPGTPPTETPLP
ncbi:MAG: 16S rRNA (cytosine(1402)-N(4))-methyltransferase RsmH [bacterium]